ncbi:hypothetical protein KC316_g5285 [Hortaea werneckii]|nr:hypothetical protein KC324_g6037 [Hortaea werneckii]KAI7587015.1 hypothetical protein KC316_g5285 [Hortaea werneckii]RMX94195.1 hypothetical protein D0868_12431 [Hortaea werneckii]RMY13050.1 hypothetical protein D0867_07581 [Hortaea werneckii]RMY31668.1 hypothetical protein D0866_07141 [Hortaea werneckii]
MAQRNNTPVTEPEHQSSPQDTGENHHVQMQADTEAIKDPDERLAELNGNEDVQASSNANDSKSNSNNSIKSKSIEQMQSEYDGLDINFEAVQHIATSFLPGNHGKCIAMRYLASGTFHVVTLLDFEDGWSCIGRFAKYKKEPLRNLESEQATVRYLKKHSPIPVAQIYLVNNNPDHVVGTTFVLQERLPGQSLSKIYDDLSIEHKLAAISQMGEVVANLGRLHFPAIGSLKEHGEVGPLQNYVYDDEPGRDPTGPHHTLKDYMFSFLSAEGGQFAAARALFPAVKENLEPLLAENAQNPILNPPWRLMHVDFDWQNVLFQQDESAGPPRLSGVVDWDCSFTGPVYYLYDYPPFIQDDDAEKDRWETNKAARKQYVKSILNSFPEGSEARNEVWECFRQKSAWLNRFPHIFFLRRWNDEDAEKIFVESYSYVLQKGYNAAKGWWHAYTGRWNYEPDSEFREDSDVESEDSSDECSSHSSE